MSKSRLEKFLYALYSLDHSDLPTPLSRIEELYKCWVTGEEVPTFKPLSRVEKYLMAILGVYDVDSLPNPLSRVEVLLYKLATGDDNLDDVKSFLSEHEELLAEIIRNDGAGGNIDIEYALYTLFTEHNTLYNTAEKPVKSAILKGQTLTNLVKQNEAYCMYIEREAITNGFHYTQLYNASSMGATRIQWDKGTGVNLFKPSTKYYIQCDIKVNKPRAMRVYSNGSGTTRFSRELLENESAHIKGTFVTAANSFDYIYFYMAPLEGTNMDDYIDDTFEIANLIIMEYQEGMENWDIPYFEGMQSVKMPVLTTTGKNLFDGEFELGTISSTNGTTASVTTAIRSKNYTKVKGNTDYIMYIGSNYKIAVVCYDENKQFLKTLGAYSSSYVFHLAEDVKYIKLRTPDKNGFDDVNVEVSLYEYETGNNVSYEPYKSNILTVNEPVELRGIGEVKDTLNLMTGEYIQRIGEVVLDGSELNEHYQIAEAQGTNTLRIDYLALKDAIMVSRNKIACDKFIVSYDDAGDYEHIRNSSQGFANICIYINRTRLTNQTIAGFKEWLSTNPITIRYELKTPIIKTVDLSVVNQDGNNTKLSTFNDITYVTLSPEGLIPEATLEVATKNEEVLNTMSLEIDDISTTQTTLDEISDAQSENVDSTMIATTEIYERLL